jgi:hypothetical protein
MVVKRDEGFPTEDIRGLFNGTHVSFFTQEEAFPEDYMKADTEVEDEEIADDEEEESHEEKEVIEDVIDDLDEVDESEADEADEESDEE